MLEIDQIKIEKKILFFKKKSNFLLVIEGLIFKAIINRNLMIPKVFLLISHQKTQSILQFST